MGDIQRMNNLTKEQKDALLNTDKIAIIGMPLAGKTTLIRELNGIDLDDVVEKRNDQSVAELLAKGTFRLAETEALTYLVQKETPLIALGGGAILKTENIALLNDYFIVFLNTPLAVLHERSLTSTRPLIKQKTDLDRLFEERYPLYVAAARIAIDSATLKHILQEKARG